jgi:NAD(P)-dependent dehydrogenase (short-subunit alcohol dehydrogenase family)
VQGDYRWPVASYGTSKAAANMLWSQFAILPELQAVTFATLSPGWVDTDMGRKGGELPQRLVKVIESLDNSRSGSFLDFTGAVVAF